MFELARRDMRMRIGLRIPDVRARAVEGLGARLLMVLLVPLLLLWDDPLCLDVAPGTKCRAMVEVLHVGPR
eukprot:8849750-Pyramimonas_sp.AAC.1